MLRIKSAFRHPNVDQYGVTAVGRWYCKWTSTMIAAIVGTILACTASASDTGSSATSNQQVSSELEEIIVTVTRREQSLEKIPISIAALSQDDLTQGGIKNIADLAAVTPGLQFATPNSFASTLTTITIRGLNSNAGPSPVGIYLDDTPIQSRNNWITNIGNTYPMVFDLNRVEVARGPQGTLFGAGSEAGTLRYISNEPSLTEFSGVSHAEFGTTEGGTPSYEIGAAAGGPIIPDELGFRVSAWERHDGGYIDLMNPLTENIEERNANTGDKSAFRAALTFAAAGVRITPSMYFQTFHTDDTSFFNGNFSDASQGRFVIAAFLPEIMTDSLALPSLKIDASLPFANLTSTTSYIHRNVRVTSDQSAWLGAGIGGFGSPLGPGFPTSPSDVTPSLFGNEVKGITQEVRLASNQKDAFFAWVAGIYFDHRTQDDIQWDSSASQPGGTVVNMAEHTLDDQIAAYVQGDFRVTSKLTATLGERVAKVNSHLNNYVGPGVFDVGIPPTSSTSLKETPNTPRVALSYQANDNNLFYISASKGFRIGGGNMPVPTNLGCTSAAPATYSSDYLWSYEVGAKNTFFDGRLQINSSVFHVAWYNIQQLVYLACLAGYIGNAGNAVSNGFDLALQGVVTQELRVALDVGYANAYYSSNVLDGAGNPLVLAGDKIGFLPQVNAPWNVNATVTYEIPLPNGDNIQLRGDHQYNSQNPGPFVSQIPKSPSYWPSLEPNPPTQVTNIRMGYTRGELNVAVFVNNVFNSTPLLSKFTITPTTNLVGYTTLRPRTTGVSANYKF